MRKTQFLVLAGMTAAALILAFLWTETAPVGIFAPPAGDDTPARLAFALHWLAVPGLSLLVGIAMTANRRFFVADAIDGGSDTANRSLEINLRYNRNTLEQLALVAIAWPALAVALPHGRLGLVPELAVVFAVGRALFWLGYLYAPWARAFGFALTFYPTVVIYAWLLLRGA